MTNLVVVLISAVFEEHVVEVHIDACLPYFAIIVGIEGVWHIGFIILIHSVYKMVVELPVGHNIGSHAAPCVVTEIPFGVVAQSHSVIVI